MKSSAAPSDDLLIQLLSLRKYPLSELFDEIVDWIEGAAPAAPPVQQTYIKIAKPHGLPAILVEAGAKTFRADGVVTDPKGWEAANILRAFLPDPMPIEGMKKKTVNSIQIHRVLKPSLEELMAQLFKDHPASYAKLQFAGSFVPRMKRGLTQPSLHGLGYAIDFNAADFPLHRGKNYKLEDVPEWFKDVVNLFLLHNWKWGGDFGDGMHFQGADGY